ncbi:sensor histidine kinase [Nitrincola nitratireducens]|uniref:histidine kinase n=1 Tax=Nitrincola nitratireducens TaxID=1229521 RepID=W9V515_9GAMM|nr:ATP-binding protein [Nitrincola nitratireducens]EXJ12026.1 Alkaline phosphatase synthesis sensor protein phoR [Nitrincola nitratireducens]
MKVNLELNALPCSVIVTDLSGHIVFINDFALTSLGLTLPLTTHTIEALFPPSAKIFLHTHLWPLLRNDGAINEIYLKMNRTHQSPLPVLLNVSKGDFKECSCYFWVIFPAEQRASFEQELLSTRKQLQLLAKDADESRYMLQTVLDGTQDIGILAVSNLGLIRFANTGMTDLTGLPPEGLINQSIFALFHDSSPEENPLKSLFYTSTEENPSIERPFSINTFETKIRRISENIDVQIQIRQLDNSKTAQDIAFIILIIDIQKRKKYEKLQDDFIANISHEFRTPVTAILGSLDLIDSEKIGNLPEKIKKLIKNSLSNAHRLKALVNDVVDFAKLKSNKLNIELRNVELYPLLTRSTEQHSTYLSEKGIRLELFQFESNISICVDPIRFEQVISNLLSNAIKFSPSFSKVKIDIYVEHNSVTISVEDQGPGVKPDFIPFLFTQFRQEKSDINRRFEGSGLGLAISKQLIEGMGGKIGYKPALSKGAIFWVSIPIHVKPIL